MLLAAAILMTKSLAKLEHQDFGITTTNRYVLHFDPAGAGYTPDRLPALYRQIEDRFSSAARRGQFQHGDVQPAGRRQLGRVRDSSRAIRAPRPGDHCGSTWDRVSTHFLDSIGVPIVRGRGFTDQDTADFTAGCDCQPDVCEAIFPEQGTDRPALWHRRRAVFERV